MSLARPDPRPIVLALAFLAAPVAAEPWNCRMTVLCQNLDCHAVDDRYEVIAADHEGQLFLTSPAGDHPVERLTRQGTLPAAYAGAGDAALGELLTIIEDGRALLSIHGYDGPARTTTLFGTCAVQ
ncbi:hypothetical protein [Hasllibacter sp. MH4015]|uniref:hypothetical protein n=1 Tax=Hasllibacter sp. MH4015 TaxID=2854029 RepID=UPI001CD5B479|nr:hypothetical protein [Hasllibacter sp. MH4015]